KLGALRKTESAQQRGGDRARCDPFIRCRVRGWRAPAGAPKDDDSLTAAAPPWVKHDGNRSHSVEQRSEPRIGGREMRAFEIGEGHGAASPALGRNVDSRQVERAGARRSGRRGERLAERVEVETVGAKRLVDERLRLRR